VSAESVFGLNLYKTLSSAKIVLNGAIDMAGDDRGNMRCFEAMGCGALLVSDTGRYPEGMSSNVTMATYKTSQDLIPLLSKLLDDYDISKKMARKGYHVIREQHNKQQQWCRFTEIVGAI
jgi:spore maturation protein CgeB